MTQRLLDAWLGRLVTAKTLETREVLPRCIHYMCRAMCYQQWERRNLQLTIGEAAGCCGRQQARLSEGEQTAWVGDDKQ